MAESGICRLLSFLTSLAFLAVGAYLLYYFLGEPSIEEIKDWGRNISNGIGDFDWGDFGDIGDVLGNLSGVDLGDVWDTDPYLSDNSTSSWPTSGQGGLQLTILHALDETWNTEFTNAISDWENGDPDALALDIQYGDIDHVCTPIDGLMKVCNGNWGDTGWLGINEILKTVNGGVIQSSVAKMNEYYLYNADLVKRQYTMCHEVGHGFGLPHTDESFTNLNLGNCLDYTQFPESNLHPDETNYKRLASLYGTVGKRRSLRSDNHRKLSPLLREAYETAIRELEHEMKASDRDHLYGCPSGWRKLKEHSQGGDFVRKLSDEYVLEVHMLYAQVYN